MCLLFNFMINSTRSTVRKANNSSHPYVHDSICTVAVLNLKNFCFFFHRSVAKCPMDLCLKTIKDIFTLFCSLSFRENRVNGESYTRLNNVSGILWPNG